MPQRHARNGIRQCRYGTSRQTITTRQDQGCPALGAMGRKPAWGKPFRRCPRRCARPSGPPTGGGEPRHVAQRQRSRPPQRPLVAWGAQPRRRAEHGNPLGDLWRQRTSRRRRGLGVQPRVEDRRRSGRSPRSRSLRRGLPCFARRPPRWACPPLEPRRGGRPGLAGRRGVQPRQTWGSGPSRRVERRAQVGARQARHVRQCPVHPMRVFMCKHVWPNQGATMGHTAPLWQARVNATWFYNSL